MINYRQLYLITAVLVLAGCKTKPAEESSPPARHVNVMVVSREEVPYTVSATGTLSSKSQSNLGFLTGGVISQVYAHEGKDVQSGQLLAKLDMTEIGSRLRQARLGLDKANRDLVRVRNLYRDSVATLEQFQDARTAMGIAQSNYNIARFNKKFSEIRAPSDGKILKQLAHENEIVGKGHPVFAFASTDAAWVLKVNLADRDVVKTSYGDTATIHFDAYPGGHFRALVSQISDAADLMTGTYGAELRLDTLPPRLVTGLVGKALIRTGAGRKIVIPVDALVEATGMEAWVFKMENGLPRRTKVSIGDITDMGIIPDSGSIRAGDSLITAGNAYVRDGMPVIVDKN
ncbi:MAG TPA: efflux RND transporter periplasmic adaptor subunit [Bacteroidales bacterium]|nr:efflux RND transporter periplasmic adaptor subunit [Bacteroidales bacterium]